MTSSRNESNEFRAWMENGKIRLECHYKFGSLPKIVTGWEWDAVNRCWWLPPTKEALEMLRGVRQAQIDHSVEEAIVSDVDGVPDPVPDDMEGIVAMMPIRLKPYAHQVAAFKRCMDVFNGGF